jgi:hypothetical protein
LYTRRSFLQLFGIAFVGASLPISLGRVPDLKGIVSPQGRALAALPVFKRPDVRAPIINRLWPDSIIPILDRNVEWYRVPNGYVLRAGLQPMLPYTPTNHDLLAALPFWAEVSGPVAPITKYCAADAPLVTRIGHGGVSKVVDSLPGEPNGWYGIEDHQGDFLGWTQANRWRPISLEPSISNSVSESGKRLLRIDTRTCQVIAIEGSKAVLRASCSFGQALPLGRYYVQDHNPGGGYWEGVDTFHGIPWLTRLDENLVLAGVYWHNRFGAPEPGPTVQVTPIVARWLYDWLEVGSAVDIV